MPLRRRLEDGVAPERLQAVPRPVLPAAAPECGQPAASCARWALSRGTAIAPATAVAATAMMTAPRTPIHLDIARP